MFSRAFRVRSNTAIKGSDRRKLRADVAAAFPNLSADQLTEFIPNKEELNVIKIYSHKGEAVTVYTNNKNPILFEIERALYPTVYTLWLYPDLLPAFSTWPPVLQKLAGGADLMLPGVVVPSSGFPQVEQGTLCAVTLLGNRAPVAVGVATMSTAEMLAAGMKGKGFAVLHTYMDHLCPAGQQLDIKKSSYKKFSKFLQCMQHQKILQVKELNKGVESIVEVDWKHPDVRAFAVPEGFASASSAQDSRSEEREQGYHAPEIIPLYGVSTKMIPLFQESGHKKGSILSSSEVRNIIINYVKANELVDETNKNFVKVNAILCDCLLDKSEQDEISSLKWDDLLSRCLERLQPLHQVTFYGQEPVVRKGNIEPIDITIAQRSSNKKVTIIKNLELYGLDPQCVANILQQKVQASATITPVPGTKDRVQVQIQGNQIHHLAKMLLEEYKLPRKYVQGLEKAPKLGRKK
ncbi:eukaryotic translation initiation factor 2D isoform X2 [Indicator indicator]|uniref:eukaryotic translation initiation factor 2D isoform X2 n=1 Tax=Indicator indicator TaxID=1002788 RepID=UPI0023DFAE84|nr:eukaryotic translation initiation factor 2D isoform X2 [Indicator indicator]